MRAVNYVLGMMAVAAMFANAGAAEAGGRPPRLEGLPASLVWQNKPAQWHVEKGSLTLAAGRKTDWFSWPGGGYTADSSPRLLFKAAGDFMFDLS